MMILARKNYGRLWTLFTTLAEDRSETSASIFDVVSAVL
jgi:hypothetical protein